MGEPTEYFNSSEPQESNLRFWVNWPETVEVERLTGLNQTLTPVVDEKEGGEIAYFTTEKLAEDYCETMNALVQDGDI